ncbi:MAG: glycosyltransferase, partial [Calditrichaeota bacterium]
MIVKNEERFLAECLESVRELVSEMVIVDTGSSDRTVEIARRYGARVIHHQWTGNFAQARNVGLAQATQPWILYLDADERLHAPHHPAVRKAVSENRADAFYIRVKSEVRGVLGNMPHVQAYPRLFRKLPGVRFVGRVHEQITPSLQANKARFALLDAEIEHLGYNQSDEILQQKIERNLAYLEKQVAEEPDNPYARFQLGQTYILANRVEEGEAQLRQAIHQGTLSPPLKGTALLILANEAYKRGQYQEAIELARQSLQVAPHQRLGWFLISDSQAALKNWAAALEALEQVEKYQGLAHSDLSMDKLFPSEVLAQRRGVYCFQLQDYAGAVSSLGAYLQASKSPRTSSLAKFVVALQKHPAAHPQALQAVENCVNHLADFDDTPQAIGLLYELCERLGQGALQQKLLEQAVALFPDEAKYLFYLGTLHLNKGHLSEAARYLKRAEQLAPDVYEVQYNLGALAIKQGRLSDAVRRFEHIVRQFPEHRQVARRKLAGLYLKMGAVEQALPLMAQLT